MHEMKFKFARRLEFLKLVGDKKESATCWACGCVKVAFLAIYMTTCSVFLGEEL